MQRRHEHFEAGHVRALPALQPVLLAFVLVIVLVPRAPSCLRIARCAEQCAEGGRLLSDVRGTESTGAAQEGGFGGQRAFRADCWHPTKAARCPNLLAGFPFILCLLRGSHGIGFSAEVLRRIRPEREKRGQHASTRSAPCLPYTYPPTDENHGTQCLLSNEPRL